VVAASVGIRDNGCGVVLTDGTKQDRQRGIGVESSQVSGLDTQVTSVRPHCGGQRTIVKFDDNATAHWVRDYVSYAAAGFRHETPAARQA